LVAASGDGPHDDRSGEGMTTPAAPPSIPLPRRTVRAIVFAHFDPDGHFDAHVQHALAAYRPLADRLVVVSNSATRLPRELVPLVDAFLPRANVGYDFAAWRDGLGTLEPDGFDEVLCVNDSVYGPLFDLAPAVADGRVADADLWGMVLSDQNTSRSAPRVKHLQSWFLGMRRPLLESDAWADFWRGVGPLASKREVVERYEIGFSARMAAAGFRVAGLFDATTAPPVTLREVWPHLSPRHPRRSWRLIRKSRRIPHNPSELTWWRLWEAGVPYLKVGLLRVNHYGLDLGRVLADLERRASYDLGLIHGHLRRCG
jgi:lipopolysaccharide biosynthesis protein